MSVPTRETEPTQVEVDAVEQVVDEVSRDPIACKSAYILAKRMKQVFVAPSSEENAV